MKSLFKAAKAMVWLTQLGISLALPPVIFLYGAYWLQNRFGLGSWILFLGIVLGLGGSAGSMVQFYKVFTSEGKKDDPQRRGYDRHE